MALNRRQFDPTQLRYTSAPHPKGGRQVAAIHGDQIVGHLSTKAPQGVGKGEPLSVAWVNPEYQRKGVATTMLGLMRHDLGYTPPGDSVLTPKGQRWQAKMGIDPVGVAVYRWAPGQEEETAETIQHTQRAMLTAPEYDPHVVQQRAPERKRRRRKQPSVEQGALWEGPP